MQILFTIGVFVAQQHQKAQQLGRTLKTQQTLASFIFMYI
jgi:hypothetical protein